MLIKLWEAIENYSWSQSVTKSYVTQRTKFETLEMETETRPTGFCQRIQIGKKNINDELL